MENEMRQKQYNGLTPNGDVEKNVYININGDIELSFSKNNAGEPSSLDDMDEIMHIAPSISLNDDQTLNDIALNENCIVVVFGGYNLDIECLMSYPRWRDILALVATYHYQNGDFDHSLADTEFQFMEVDADTGLNRYAVYLSS